MWADMGSEILKKLMDEFGMSQVELWRKTKKYYPPKGVSRRTIQRLLMVENANLTERSLSAIAAVFGITVSQLLGEKKIDKSDIIPKLSPDAVRIAQFIARLPKGDYRRILVEKMIKEEYNSSNQAD